MNSLSKSLYVSFTTLLCTVFFVSSAWSIPLTGTYTDDDARVVYTVGTSRDDNPAVGLEFYAEGAVTYDYSMDYAIDAKATTVLFTGQSKQLDGDDIAATLTRQGGVSLTTTQTVTTGTDFFFGIDTWLTGDIDFVAGLPDIEVSGVTLTLNNTGSLQSTGTSFEDKSANWGAGAGIISGGSDIMFDEAGQNAWAVDVDLVSIIDALAPIDWLVDLNLGLGLDVVQDNLMALIGYDFDIPSFTLEAMSTAGTYFADVTGTLLYDLVFQSDYDYSGDAFLNFDAPLIDPINLWEADLGQFDVGTMTNIVTHSIPVTFSMEYRVFDEEDCSGFGGNIVCRAPGFAPVFSPPLLSEFERPFSTEYYAVNRIDDKIDLTQPIPEPPVSWLFAAGLVGLLVSRTQPKTA